jgi:uncharacterized protein YbjQ (UPF0145 family)
MTNKKDDDDRKDLTRIEDLSEFLHQDDPEIDNIFGTFNSPSSSNAESESLVNLDELDSELPPELPVELDAEVALEPDVTFESNETNEFNSDEITNFDYSEHSEILSEIKEEANQSEVEANFEVDSASDLEINNFVENDHSFIEELDQEAEIISLDPIVSEDQIQENFEEVKNFAQNFSYGTIEGAGNPPFSIIIRNIKFKEEAEDILSLLKEFGIINDQNAKEMEMAINLGSLLISQISEYTTIVLAHKLRRYDLDIEVGLSDEIHPSKSGENNPKGLTKKSSIKQNIEESFKKPEKNFKISDMIITNSSTIPNYKIIKILGIEHAHCLLTEDEISRGAYINQRLLAQDINTSEMEDFKNYKKDQDELHNILLAEIKNKAFKEGANALLSVQFNLNSISDHKQHFMKLTCTCTKVILEHE